LAAQSESLLEQIKQGVEYINVSKRLEEMEQLKQVKEISEEGVALAEMFVNIQDIEKELMRFSKDPLGANKTIKEIERLRRTLKNANKLEGTARGETLANMVADLERLKFLGKAKKATMKKVKKGLNEQDAIKGTAQSTLLMSDLLFGQEERESIRRSQETNAVLELIEGVNYSSVEAKDE